MNCILYFFLFVHFIKFSQDFALVTILLCALGWNTLISKNVLCPVIQNLLALRSDLASSDWFPLISSPDNGCKAGSTSTSLLTSSSISAMFSLNSLCLRVTNPPFLHDVVCHTLYGFEKPQWLGSLFSGSPYLYDLYNVL